jgi:hypothetical protein
MDFYKTSIYLSTDLSVHHLSTDSVQETIIMSDTTSNFVNATMLKPETLEKMAQTRGILLNVLI